MNDISILIGGKSGDGIESTAPVIAKLLQAMGFYVHVYRDYPSLIRGGHTFSIIRGSKKRIGAIRDKVDIILALNQDSIDNHKERVSGKTLVIFDSDQARSKGLGVALTKTVNEMELPPVVRNIGLVGAMCKAIDIDWRIAEKVIRENTPKKIEENVKIARFGFEKSNKVFKLAKSKSFNLPIFFGNEIIALGLVKAGLSMYIAYPMTPASSVLHFLAEKENDFGIKVVHPESEIGVIMMANGAAYAGSRVAVGSSGGGFALMTEGVSLSGMGEFPVTIVMSQRPGPATGLPTYSAQADLGFVLNSGHGEFTRIVVAPGDAEQTYYWSGKALNLSWKYQTPSIILVDKTISESVYDFDVKKAEKVSEEKASLWGRKGLYKRYKFTKTGVSPMAFPGDSKAIVKGTSYEHDEYGITTEEAVPSVLMLEKRLKKEIFLAEEIGKLRAVEVFGNKKSKTAIVCWGSTKEVAREVGESLGIKVIQPVVLSPFPVKQLEKALKGVTRLIGVETNATAQLATLLRQYSVEVNDIILKYDSRPITVNELEQNIKRLKK